MEWSEENLIKLIDVYRSKYLLWDPRHKDHLKKTLKADAWGAIGEEMEISAEICKKKIVSLLSSYRREKSKIKTSQSTGKGRDEIYESRWFAYETFKFLEDRDEPRKRLMTETDDILGNEDDIEASVNPPAQSQSEKTAPSYTRRPTKETKRAADNNASMMSSAFNILSETAKKMDNQPTKPNEIDSFFTYVATKVNKYSPTVQNSVQYVVFDILTKADTGFYNWAAPNLQQSNQWQNPPNLQQFNNWHSPPYLQQSNNWQNPPESVSTHSEQSHLQPLHPNQASLPLVSPSDSMPSTSCL